MHEDSTQSLVTRAQEGDQAAFDQLVVGLRDRLRERIRAKTGKHLRVEADTEDLLQETLLWAFRSLDRFHWQGDGSFYRWLSSIADHMILNAAKRHERGRKLQMLGDVPSDTATPSKTARRHERFDRLQTALEQLSPAHREVIMLARIEALPIKEIARRMDRSPDAVMQLLTRALRKLRSLFGDTESLHLPERKLNVRRTEDGD